MKKVECSFFCFLLLLILLNPVFGLGGLQKQKDIVLKVGEEKALEVLLWSNKEEELELSFIGSDNLEVKIPNKLIKLNPLIGEEVVFLGNNYYNASLIRVFVKPKIEGVYRVSLIVSAKPSTEGLSTRKEIIFNFILNVTSLDLDRKTYLVKSFKEEKFEELIILISTILVIIVISYGIYKKA